jgi:hypothetical protein
VGGVAGYLGFRHRYSPRNSLLRVDGHTMARATLVARQNGSIAAGRGCTTGHEASLVCIRVARHPGACSGVESATVDSRPALVCCQYRYVSAPNGIWRR